MTTPVAHAYSNEDGDWWVRVDQCPDESEARAVVERETSWPVRLLGQATTRLTECEDFGSDGCRHRGRRRLAWHFEDLPELVAPRHIEDGIAE